MPDPGLCGHCANAHVVENRRGSRFHRCLLSDTDARFPRYPLLPVVTCAGHDEGEPLTSPRPSAADG